MSSSLASVAYRHPRRMALGALLAFGLAGAFGGPAAGLFKAQNAFQDPRSDSARAEALVKRLTGREDLRGGAGAGRGAARERRGLGGRERGLARV